MHTFEPLKPPRYAIDIETRSGASLPDVGIYRYAEDPSTRISLLGVTDLLTGDTQIVQDLDEVKDILQKIATGEECMVAHNAAFDATLLWYKYLEPVFGAPPEAIFRAWDTQDFTRIRNEIPSKSGLISLEKAAEFYCGVKKDVEGAALTKLVCRTYPTEAEAKSQLKKAQKIVPEASLKDVGNGYEIVNTMERESEYCATDVAVVVELYEKLNYCGDNNPILGSYAPFHREEQYLTNKMNFWGVTMDVELLKEIQRRGELYVEKAIEAHILITGYKPSQAVRNIDWLTKKLVPLGVPKVKSYTTGKMIYSTGAKGLNQHLNDLGDKDPALSAELLKIMVLKNNTWKRVIKALNTVDDNNRLRGSLVHYGAGATGRWTSVGFQLQNIPRPTLRKDKLDELMALPADFTDFSEATNLMKSALRPCVVTPPGKTFFISDYAQIELRMSFYLTGQMEALRTLVHEDLYIDYAKIIYPGVEILKKGDERQFAKSVILAGQYGAGTARLLQSYIEVKGAVPDVDMTMVHIKFHERFPGFKVAHQEYTDMLEAALPVGKLIVPLSSGRNLIYDNLTVEFVENSTTGRVSRIIKSNGRKIYGPMIFQNVCQAESKDILALKAIMFYRDNPEFQPAFLVHDENVAETDENYILAEAEAKWDAAAADQIEKIWPGFLLNSESHLSKYYYKF